LKPKSNRQKHAKKQQSKPLPEAVIERLEKKKSKLAKKLEEPKEIKKPSKYKKRQKSYQNGMDSLDAQIAEHTEEMIKSLKKREVPESLNAILNEEKAHVTRNEVGQSLRERAIQAQKALATEKANKIKEDREEGA
jgi:hypothetical protein